jgi:hypothetical protein
LLLLLLQHARLVLLLLLQHEVQLLLLLQLLALPCGCQGAAPDSCCKLHPLNTAGLNLCNVVEVEEPAAAQQISREKVAVTSAQVQVRPASAYAGA